MNEVKKELVIGDYAAPEAKVVYLQSEGALCGSVIGMRHEDFTVVDSFEL